MDWTRKVNPVRNRECAQFRTESGKFWLPKSATTSCSSAATVGSSFKSSGFRSLFMSSRFVPVEEPFTPHRKNSVKMHPDPEILCAFIDKGACFAIFSGFTFMSQMRNKMSHHGLDAEGG